MSLQVSTTTAERSCGSQTATSIGLCCLKPRNHSPSKSLGPYRERCRISMLWLSSSAWANRRLCGPISAGLIAIACPAVVCRAQVEGLRPPASVAAGRETSISTTGSGKATFYLAGPSSSTKRAVSLGEDIRLQPAELQSAGRYVAVICSQTCQSAAFYVTAAKPSTLSFLVHPSRVPVGQSDALSRVALPFDSFRHLVVEPLTIGFPLTAGAGPLVVRPVRTP